MSETKFTPGPWTVVIRGERGTYHIPESQKHEAATEDSCDGCTVSHAMRDLLSAAPDMYAALHAMVDVVAPSFEDEDPANPLLPSYRAACAALDKARGKA